MKWENYYLCVFESKNHALLLYTLLESTSNNVAQLVSTPCSLKVGCTYSIRIPHKSYLSIIKNEAESIGIQAPRIYFVDKVEGKIKYREVGY